MFCIHFKLFDSCTFLLSLKRSILIYSIDICGAVFIMSGVDRARRPMTRCGKHLLLNPQTSQTISIPNFDARHSTMSADRKISALRFGNQTPCCGLRTLCDSFMFEQLARIMRKDCIFVDVPVVVESVRAMFPLGCQIPVNYFNIFISI